MGNALARCDMNLTEKNENPAFVFFVICKYRLDYCHTVCDFSRDFTRNVWLYRSFSSSQNNYEELLFLTLNARDCLLF